MANQPVLNTPSRRSKITCGAITAVILLLMLGLSYGFGSPIHWSEDIHGTVIDEETGQPLAGVAVCAKWILASFGGPEAIVLYDAAAVTDAHGRYVLHGMPLRLRPPLTWFGIQDPELFFYKPGYVNGLMRNGTWRDQHRSGYTRSAKRYCSWDRKTIPLARADSIKMEVATLRFAESYLIGKPSDMTPTEYPAIWQIVVDGYRHLPTDVQAQTANPQQTVDYYRSNRGMKP